jgi:predicted ABC-type ATPase
MAPTLTIIRGLPGSGKSHLGRKIAAERGCMFIEPDMLLMHGGEYIYTPTQYQTACKRAFNLVYNLTAENVDVVYADVLPRIQDIESFVWRVSEFNESYASSLEVIDMPLITVEQSLERNKHNVREEDIRRMAAQWQPWKIVPVEADQLSETARGTGGYGSTGK